MELKLGEKLKNIYDFDGFNRTFMELKPARMIKALIGIRVLIGPSWN